MIAIATIEFPKITACWQEEEKKRQSDRDRGR